MNALGWIITSSLLMSSIALVGSVTLVLKKETLEKITLPMVAFAAGTLIGGAFLHMIPSSINSFDGSDAFYLWILAGFTAFFILELILHWHHCHSANSNCKQPLTYLILIGDGLHNYLGGLAIAGTFLIDIRLGIMAWLAAAAHEIPQELGDFAVLVNGGWKKSTALIYNVISALTFLLGGLTAYFVSFIVDIEFLIPFAAGNFIYIGASDLVPEINKHGDLKKNSLHLISFIFGISLMWLIKFIMST